MVSVYLNRQLHNVYVNWSNTLFSFGVVIFGTRRIEAYSFEHLVFTGIPYIKDVSQLSYIFADIYFDPFEKQSRFGAVSKFDIYVPF